jgi:hypothetical protein
LGPALQLGEKVAHLLAAATLPANGFAPGAYHVKSSVRLATTASMSPLEYAPYMRRISCLSPLLMREC